MFSTVLCCISLFGKRRRDFVHSFGRFLLRWNSSRAFIACEHCGGLLILRKHSDEWIRLKCIVFCIGCCGYERCAVKQRKGENEEWDKEHHPILPFTCLSLLLSYSISIRLATSHSAIITIAKRLSSFVYGNMMDAVVHVKTKRQNIRLRFLIH